MTEINDELMMPCADCCRKHLSAAVAHYADAVNSGNLCNPGMDAQYHGVLLARALINLCEAEEGYGSHRPFAVGLLVKAEQECTDSETRNVIRGLRLDMCGGKRYYWSGTARTSSRPNVNIQTLGPLWSASRSTATT